MHAQQVLGGEMGRARGTCQQKRKACRVLKGGGTKLKGSL
jgi:hypothetical protein